MKYSLIMLLALATATGACTSGNNSSAVLPTSPTVPLTTETFTGVVPLGGTDFHPFVVSQTGELDITLTAAGPPSTITMGLGVGTVSGTSCVFLSNATTTTRAGTTPQLTSTSFSPGSYCVAVVDILNAASPITYSLTVVHS